MIPEGELQGCRVTGTYFAVSGAEMIDFFED